MIKIGYRSDVRIVTSKDGFKKLTEFVEKYLKDKDMETSNLLNECDVKVEGKNQHYFGWNYIKWYENDNYVYVNAIKEGLNYLKENKYSYRYMRIGEDYDDYDEYGYDSDRESEPILEYPCMFREFDDNYVIDNITELQQSVNMEDVKESVDI